jgi:hypothetical protein
MKLLLSALCCLIGVPCFSQVCRSAEYRKLQLLANPKLAGRPVVVTGEPIITSALPPTITIPVVVHVVYNTAAENISDEQIRSQIAVLNADYQKKNSDTLAIPTYYRSLAAGAGFRFGLALQDTDGRATTGIVRRQTAVESFTIDDGIKSSVTGGDDGWDRDRYLNIWVGNLGGNLLGYSSIIGGPTATDGVVVLYTAFGTEGVAKAPFNRGRTATHEIGHWLNLIHTWGDDSCGNDEVSDTPPQGGPDYGDPGGVVLSCNNAPYGNLYMDFMDFTDDIGMHLFTNGQRDRMRSLFLPGGFRAPLLTANIPVAVEDSAPKVVAAAEVLTAWPNPAVNQVTVGLSDPGCIGGLLEVYDQLGRKVVVVRVTALSQTIDVSGWTSGVFFVRLVGGTKSGVIKIMKI